MNELFDKLAEVEDETLTGRSYHKQTFMGLVLMVEYKYTIHVSELEDLPMTRWRHAEPKDLFKLKLV